MTTAARYGILLICGLLQACAGSQVKTGDALADSVGKENLDLMFATEFPVASKQEAIAKSNTAYRGGDLDKALFYSVKALRFDATDVDVLVRIANLHMLQRNSRMAARAFNLALEQEPSHPESLQGIGLLYFGAGNAEKARQNLEQAVARDAGLWKSWNILGVLADGREEFAVAQQCYDKALEVQPAAVSVLINRGWSHYLAGDLRTAARELYDVASRSGNPTAWRNLGMVYAEMGWYTEALEVFRNVEDEASAFNRTGEIALENRDLDVAYDYFSEALRQSPVYFADAERNLARVQETRTDGR